MIATAPDFVKIIVADLALSGDNALILGMAAAALAPDLRAKAILYFLPDLALWPPIPISR